MHAVEDDSRAPHVLSHPAGKVVVPWCRFRILLLEPKVDHYPHAIRCLLQIFRCPLTRDQEEAEDWGPLVRNLPLIAGEVGVAASTTVNERCVLK